MTQINRRSWLKTLTTAGAGAVLLSPAEIIAAIPDTNNPNLNGMVRLSSNENPYSPSPAMKEAIAAIGPDLCRYPNSHFRTLEALIAEREGLDPSQVETYYHIQSIREKLKFAEMETARQYLSQGLPAEEAIAQLRKYLQFSQERAEQRIRFYDKYRSYTINYSLGEDLVSGFMEDAGRDPEARWELFNELLTTPRTASNL